jgi:aminopeptidase N
MTTAKPQPIFRKDYQAPTHLIDRVDLRFELADQRTRVITQLHVRKNAARSDANGDLHLSGEDLTLFRVAVDGATLEASAYSVDEHGLTIFSLDGSCVVETEVEIDPDSNTKLSGLYRSNGVFCTQCEAEGFRRITYMLDRPDVMSRYRTTIVAQPKLATVLLSNGNPVERTDMPDGSIKVVWEDPFPKPAYLFALVAGHLQCHSGNFTTKSGRNVKLEIWVEPHNLDKCEHALESLRRAMRWDEAVFGLEYDLDIYMIVAVSDFNMGAMENKGLNVFNTKYVLAKPETATDDDYENIAAVVAHEYFHNWTGNRVTCRDWFQLTLKEGLTVFRDQLFTADMGSAAIKRIQDVRKLRSAQFAEDAGPMSHPIRPESYIEMNNFYTTTVYEKGAEVVRMYQTLLGKQGFRRGMDLYFRRHDGQAVTCDDFRAAMADANGVDFALFERWYSDAGTPTVHSAGTYDPSTSSYRLTLKQSGPAAPGQKNYRARHIPVSVGLIGPSGQDLPLTLEGEVVRSLREGTPNSRTLELTSLEQEFVFSGLQQAPVLSALRDFSAPVHHASQSSRDELAFLMAHDSDPFNRWDAGQTLAMQCILEGIAQFQAHPSTEAISLDPRFTGAFERLLADDRVDPSLKSFALMLPEERQIALAMKVVDPDAIFAVRNSMRQILARTFIERWRSIYDAMRGEGPYRNDGESIARRRLKNVALAYLALSHDAQDRERAAHQFRTADNMTDMQAALICLNDEASESRAQAFATFHERWQDDALVLDKWFAIQALSSLPNTVDEVRRLAAHPDFKRSNPNRFRALIGNFGLLNQARFHALDGSGYELVANEVLAMDALNPQTAARVVASFNPWRTFGPERQQLMRVQLERMLAQPNLSRDVYEIVSRCLS